MKKTLLIVLILIFTVFSFAACEKKNGLENAENTGENNTAFAEDIEVTYVYVTACGDDWIFGNDTIIYCGKNHGYDVFDTVKVEYYTKDVIEENGVVTMDVSGYSYENTYNRIIKNVVFSRKSDQGKREPIIDKPVIYLYPEETTEVFVKLDFDGKLTETIPAYGNGWHVAASPDGKLTDDDGKTYPYLFWEGVPNCAFTITEGFCVRGSQTREFLEKILPEIGLNENEYTEFIEYWLGQMENNEYNLIQFNDEKYYDAAKLDIAPKPDSVLRVFMTYCASEEYIPLKKQTITPFVRSGFTVVEWGGTCLD